MAQDEPAPVQKSGDRDDEEGSSGKGGEEKAHTGPPLLEQSPDPEGLKPDAARPGAPHPFTVGIGASAGGVDALRSFLEAFPAESGIAFVVVVHLSPEHQSHLAEILQPSTEMPVTQATEMVRVEPDHVYVIPPNRNLSSLDTHLRLSPLEESRHERAPIDHFFRTLAQTHDGKAIGVVLSGSGADGAVGLRAIKEAGGLILAQAPAEATYDGMPQSAIATGMVDDVLPAAEMAGRILTYVSTRPVLAPSAEEAGSDEAQRESRLLQKMFARLRSVTGHDFSRYKRGTVGRRLARRMQLHGKTSLEGYLDLLRNQPDEVGALFRDLLIVVTNFFREPESFEALAEQVIPAIFAGKGADGEVRVWVPGCATGEEAYSLAILLLEQAGQGAHPPAIQIFATDLSDEALAVAREGVYPEAIVADVPPELLERYFTRENGAYRVQAELREMVLFAPHSLLKDPPFSRLDLVSCRNLLIYLQRDVQEQALRLFHYALDPGGFLFLGSSETVEERTLFQVTSAQHGIYRRKEVATSIPRLPSLPLIASAEVPAGDVASVQRQQQAGSYGTLHQQLAERHAPPSILVDEDHRLVHVSERAGRYLRIRGGELNDNVLRLVRDELQAELATLIYRAFHHDQSSRSTPIALVLEGQTRAVSLYVEPAEEKGQPFALVYFLESDGADAAPETVAASDEVREDLVQQLQAELAATKGELRTAVEEFESSREEMKASNEELQSMNEELRSTTEELETSKEELQSMNEELLTVNEENKNKVEELRQMTADLQNLMAATDIATVFLDRRLQIQRFTPSAAELFNIRHSDRGRPLAHLTHRLAGYDGLLDDAERVLAKLAPVEEEVTDEAGRHYFLRIRPYRTTQDRIGGVVITLMEITSLREIERALAESRERYRLLVEGSTEYAMFTMDEEGRIDSWNAGARRILGYGEEEILNRPGVIIYTPEDRAEGAFEAELRQAREEGKALNERWHRRKDGSRFWGSGVVTSLWDDGTLRGFAKVMRDNTERKAAEAALRQSEARFRALVNATAQMVWTTDAEGTVVADSPSWRAFTGQTVEEWLDWGWANAVHPDDRADAVANWREAVETETPLETEMRLQHVSGDWRWTHVRAVPMFDQAGNVSGWVGMNTDITERKQAEQALRESRRALQELAEELEARVEARTAQVRRLASELVASEQTVRQRIAQSLHDDLQQMLYAAEVQLQLAKATIQENAEVEELEEMLGAAITLTRRLTVEMSPPVLEGEGLPEALQWLAHHMQDVYGLRVTLTVGERPWSGSQEQRVLLFQIVRELLFNVVKHAGVEEARVQVAGSQEGLTVSVIDRGRGFDVEQVEAESEGFGLHSVRERIALFDGRVEIDSQAGKGTRVTLFLPDAVLTNRTSVSSGDNAGDGGGR